MSDALDPEVHSTDDALIGQLVGQRYQVLNCTSSHADHVVYRARQSALDRYVTLKVFRKAFETNLSGAQFHRHARALARLRHRHVVTLYDHGLLDSGERFIVQEHIEGVTLSQWLTEVTPSLELIFSVGVDVLTALEESHRLGILHRRVHPSTIYLEQVSEPPTIRLGDFSFPSVVECVSPTSDDRSAYAIPEAQKGEALTERSDLFCVGRLLEDLLERCVQQEYSPEQSFGNWSDEANVRFRDFLMHLRAAEPTERPQSARTARRALSAFLMAVQSGPRSRADERPAAQAAERAEPTQAAERAEPTQAPPPVAPDAIVPKKSLPGWKYIVTLGLVSAVAIGLVLLQKAAHEELGTDQMPGGEQFHSDVEAEVQLGSITVHQRFRDLLDGRIVGADWFVAGPDWMTSALRIQPTEFGLDVKAFSRSTPQSAVLARWRSALRQGGLPDADVRRLIAFEWFARQRQHARVSEASFREALRAGLAWDGLREHHALYAFLLGFSFEADGRLNTALQFFQRGALASERTVWSDRCQLRSIPIALTLGHSDLAQKMISSALNSSEDLHRKMAHFFQGIERFVAGDDRQAIDYSVTLVETIESIDAQRESLRTRGLELLALAGGRLGDEGALAELYLLNLGGDTLVDYYEPLLELFQQNHQPTK